MKYRLDRKSLEKLYTCIEFIRPILEYGGLVWENCNQRESDRMEIIQVKASRIITGKSHDILYEDLQWDKIPNGEIPEDLLNEIIVTCE